jgi:hypothetical protein
VKCFTAACRRSIDPLDLARKANEEKRRWSIRSLRSPYSRPSPWGPSLLGLWAVDPHLPGCEEVAVDIRRLGEYSRLPTDPWAEDDDQGSSPGLGPCAMMVLIAPRHQDVALEASTADRRLGRAQIEAPHNHIWLAVVPLAATADLALFIATLPIGVTTSTVGGETTYYTWTWTP